MNIPSFSYDFVVNKDGKWSYIWNQIMSQLLQQMQNDLSDEGYVIPSLTTSQISQIAAGNVTGSTNPNRPIMVYNSTTDSYQAWSVVSQTFKTFTLT